MIIYIFILAFVHTKKDVAMWWCHENANLGHNARQKLYSSIYTVRLSQTFLQFSKLKYK